MIKAILFDMDGVLVRSERIIRKASKAALKEWGINAVDEDFIPFVGAGEDRFVGGVAEAHGVPYDLKMKERTYEIYLGIVDDEIEIYDGLHDVLKELKDQGYTLAVCSSADRIKVEANLRAAKISMDTFKAVVSGDEVVNKKPFPDVFLKGAEKAGVAPENCVVIEDAINGIQAAKAAGMKSVGFTSFFKKEVLEKENPSAVIESLRDLPSALEKIS